MNDPIRAWRLAFKVVLVLGALGVALAGWYAFAPPEKFSLTMDAADVLDPPEVNLLESPATSLAFIDASVFDVSLWYSPPNPTPVKTEDDSTHKPPALRVELIGIIEEAGVRLAAVYDSTADRMLILATGETVQDYTITAIEARSVIFSHGSHDQILSLAEPPAFKLVREAPS